MAEYIALLSYQGGTAMAPTTQQTQPDRNSATLFPDHGPKEYPIGSGKFTYETMTSGGFANKDGSINVTLRVSEVVGACKAAADAGFATFKMHVPARMSKTDMALAKDLVREYKRANVTAAPQAPSVPGA